MKICDMCKSKDVNYSMSIEQTTKEVGLALWELDFCRECVKRIESTLEEILDEYKSSKGF